MHFRSFSWFFFFIFLLVKPKATSVGVAGISQVAPSLAASVWILIVIMWFHLSLSKFLCILHTCATWITIFYKHISYVLCADVIFLPYRKKGLSAQQSISTQPIRVYLSVWKSKLKSTRKKVKVDKRRREGGDKKRIGSAK